MSHFYELTPRDPLVLRDNRFMVGNVMHSAGWITPSVMAGSLRTAKGKAEGGFDVKVLQAIAVAGPFPVKDGALCFEPPADLLALKDKDSEEVQLHPLVPGSLRDGEGSDLPGEIRPCILDMKQKGKPVKIPGFWNLERMEKWLASPVVSKVANEKELHDLPRPQVEERTHVKVKHDTGTASDGDLFVTQGLVFPYSLSVRVSDAGTLGQSFAHPVGGERRQVLWEKKDAPKGWECPEEVLKALKSTKSVRMVLATPAIFSRGWLPGWLDGAMTGIVPGTSVKVKLVSACLNRWEAVSGWSFTPVPSPDGKECKPGPKPIRRTVPAGSVYFFEILEGDASELAKVWLQPVSDLDNGGDPEGLVKNDGFGLALWGIGHDA